MRQTQIFSGSSHPHLVGKICERLGQAVAKAELGHFSNGETKVQLNTHVRDQDVFIVQSGSDRINDTIMELLVMVDACRGGSAKSVTAVLPYFPYSRQSKKKSHRGAVTARMFANLLEVAGVTHAIAIDLHSSQMQGFFHCPVDNLAAQPLIARWIRLNIPDWKIAVVVGKNPGGAKRVTSLADALKLGFGIVMTERSRHRSTQNSRTASMIFDQRQVSVRMEDLSESFASRNRGYSAPASRLPAHSRQFGAAHQPASPLSRRVNGEIADDVIVRTQGSPTALPSLNEDSADENLPDDEPRELIRGRFVHGHIVDEEPESHNSSEFNTHENTRRGSFDESDNEQGRWMTSSILSTTSSASRNGQELGLGGSGDAAINSGDDEEVLQDPDGETTVTFVGNVRGRPVLVVDDIMDKPGSWTAAAETVVKRGRATKVFCIATHGLFSEDCLREIEECDCIHKVIVTNSVPIPSWKAAQTTKLEIIDVSNLLAEAIRRNHHGESISHLFYHPI